MYKADSTVVRTLRWCNYSCVAKIYNFQEYPLFKLIVLSTLSTVLTTLQCYLHALYIHMHIYICMAHICIQLKYMYHSVRDKQFGLNPGSAAYIA